MRPLHRFCFLLCLFVPIVSGIGISASTAAERPVWSPVIIAKGEYKAYIKSLPIEERPNRPFHFYGNTIRRINYLKSSLGPTTRALSSRVRRILR